MESSIFIQAGLDSVKRNKSKKLTGINEYYRHYMNNFNGFKRLYKGSMYEIIPQILSRGIYLDPTKVEQNLLHIIVEENF